MPPTIRSSSATSTACCRPSIPTTASRCAATVRSGCAQNDLVAYFCAEFGFHESLPIYSGGLGILAGDHCKSASDMRLPFIGVGLLYRQGYFHQTIDAEGNQHALYTDSDFEDLPVTPVLRDDGIGSARQHRSSRAARACQSLAARASAM